MSMISDRQVVCLSSVPWSFLPTSRHHLARLFAEKNDVLFVDPPGNVLRFGRDEPVPTGQLVEKGRWGHLYREEGRLHRLVPSRRLPYGGEVRFRIATPTNQDRYARSVEAGTRMLGFREVVLWDVTMVYLARRVAERLRPSVHCVHMTDDLWSYPWYRKEYDEFLQEELASADFAVGTTEEITTRLAAFGVAAHVIGHGVDPERFAPSSAGVGAPPRLLADLPRPLVGFAGNIESRVDVALVERLAAGHGTVVLVGPSSLSYRDRTRLERSGVILAGSVSYDDLPAYLWAFDVGIVPYTSTDLVRRSRPLKLLEMLAAGLPVVCTDMVAARELEPVVRVAATHDDFVEAVRSECTSPSTSVAERLRVAEENSWRARAEELSALIEAVPLRTGGRR